MIRALVLVALAAGGCSAPPLRPFPVGLAEPVSPRLAVEARRMGIALAAQAPPGAAVVTTTAAVVGAAGETTADLGALRAQAARAIAGGSAGVFFLLPRASEGRDILEYPEEWQAVRRAVGELLLMRPVLEAGVPAPAPFAVPPGVETRSWTYAGRRYVLLVNGPGAQAPLETESLAPWRALFSARSDARQSLAVCGDRRCLPPDGVLWLEGRLFPETRP